MISSMECSIHLYEYEDLNKLADLCSYPVVVSFKAESSQGFRWAEMRVSQKLNSL